MDDNLYMVVVDGHNVVEDNLSLATAIAVARKMRVTYPGRPIEVVAPYLKNEEE